MCENKDHYKAIVKELEKINDIEQITVENENFYLKTTIKNEEISFLTSL